MSHDASADVQILVSVLSAVAVSWCVAHDLPFDETVTFPMSRDNELSGFLLILDIGLLMEIACHFLGGIHYICIQDYKSLWRVSNKKTYTVAKTDL